MSNDDASPIDIRISEIITHPNFTITEQYDNIGLIRLEKSVDFNSHIRPACLPSSNELKSNEAFLAGWPFKYYNPPRPFRSKTDMELRKYIMKIIPHMECSSSYAKLSGDNATIMDTQFCAVFQMFNDSSLKPPRNVDVSFGVFVGRFSNFVLLILFGTSE